MNPRHPHSDPTPEHSNTPNDPAPLTPALWAEAKQLLLEALQLPADQRTDFALRRAGHDPTLLAHVRSLLDADSDAPSFIDRPETTVEAAVDIPAGSAVLIPLPGQTFGSSRLISLIGEGSTGLVYLAEQARPRRQVAVKILRPGQSSPTALRRFEREAEIMARLRHPGIAQVIESGIHQIGPFFVMEYVQGEPVTRYARHARLSIEDRLHLFLRVCDAAQHAHAMGVVHHDLKPANILVTPAGEPKILDFGVARAVEQDARHATLVTPLGQLIGTLAYMAPEQAAGATDAVDIRTDVYALGVILYELLAERPPHDVASRPLHEALCMIQSETPMRLGSISRACRGDLETIASKALEKMPERRYASVSELAGDIRRHLDRLPIQARRASVVYECVRFTQRHRPLVAGVAIALAGLVGALAWSLVSRERAHRDFLIARSVAGPWLPNVMNALERTPGTFNERTRMIEQLRGPLERFSERYPNDLEVRANLAALSFATGDLQIETGDFCGAMRSFGDAFDALATLASEHPSRAEWRLQQSIAAVKIGDLLNGKKQKEESITWYVAALSLDITAVRDFPDNYTAHDQLIWSYDRLANMHLDIGCFADGSRYCDLMENASIELLRRWPGKPKAVWCRIGALHTMAHVASEAGEDDCAVEYRRRALSLGRELVKVDPNRGYATGQITALAEHAYKELRALRPELAEQYLAEARPLVERSLLFDRHDLITHIAALHYYVGMSQLHAIRGEQDAIHEATRHIAFHSRAIANRDRSSFDAALRRLTTDLSHLNCLAAAKSNDELTATLCGLYDATLETTIRFPGEADPYFILIHLCQGPHLATRNPELALAAAEKADALRTSAHPDPFVLLADLLEQQDNAPAAAHVLRRALLLPDAPLDRTKARQARLWRLEGDVAFSAKR